MWQNIRNGATQIINIIKICYRNHLWKTTPEWFFFVSSDSNHRLFKWLSRPVNVMQDFCGNEKGLRCWLAWLPFGQFNPVLYHFIFRLTSVLQSGLGILSQSVSSVCLSLGFRSVESAYYRRIGLFRLQREKERSFWLCVCVLFLNIAGLMLERWGKFTMSGDVSVIPQLGEYN